MRIYRLIWKNSFSLGSCRTFIASLSHAQSWERCVRRHSIHTPHEELLYKKQCYQRSILPINIKLKFGRPHKLYYFPFQRNCNFLKNFSFNFGCFYSTLIRQCVFLSYASVLRNLIFLKCSEPKCRSLWDRDQTWLGIYWSRIHYSPSWVEIMSIKPITLYQ